MAEGSKKLKDTIVTTVVTIVITAILTVIGTFIKQQWIDPFPFTVRVAYVDSKGRHIDLPGSDVIPQINNVEGKKTNSYGEAIFQNVEPHPFERAVIEVRHSGYEYDKGAKDPVIPVRRRNDVINVLLRPLTPEAAEVPRDTGAASVGREASTGNQQDVGPAQQQRPGTDKSTPEVFISTCRSGPLPSGAGADSSPLYSLCSDAGSCVPPIPGPDYVIQSDRFELVGDRQCNAWSKCTREPSSNSKKVCYTFQMQGHSEWKGPFGLGGSGIANSEGILTVTWAHP